MRRRRTAQRRIRNSRLLLVLLAVTRAVARPRGRHARARQQLAPRHPALRRRPADEQSGAPAGHPLCGRDQYGSGRLLYVLDRHAEVLGLLLRQHGQLRAAASSAAGTFSSSAWKHVHLLLVLARLRPQLDLRLVVGERGNIRSSGAGRVARSEATLGPHDESSDRPGRSTRGPAADLVFLMRERGPGGHVNPGRSADVATIAWASSRHCSARMIRRHRWVMKSPAVHDASSTTTSRPHRAQRADRVDLGATTGAWPRSDPRALRRRPSRRHRELAGDHHVGAAVMRISEGGCRTCCRTSTWSPVVDVDAGNSSLPSRAACRAGRTPLVVPR